MAWVLWSLPEIEADFSAIYHMEVDLMDSERSTAGLSGPRFLNRCEQLPHYQGAVRASAIRWSQEQEAEPETAAALMLNPDLEVTRA